MLPIGWVRRRNLAKIYLFPYFPKNMEFDAVGR